MFGLGSDMSGYYYRNPVFGPNKSDWVLAIEEVELGWTCPIQELDMSD
jgi:hypothetical protein